MPQRAKKKGLDQIDVTILETLQEDASLTNQAIGERVGLTPGPTHSRIKRLKEEGIVRGIHADLDWNGLGYEFFATVDIKVLEDRADEAEEWLARIPNVWNLCRLKDPESNGEVVFRFWSVSDCRETFLTICHSMLTMFDGFTDVQVQEVDWIARKSAIVKVGRVALGTDAFKVWDPQDVDLESEE